MDIYLKNDQYDRMVAALTAIRPCPFEGKVTADQIKLALGEHGGIWPKRIEAVTRRLLRRK